MEEQERAASRTALPIILIAAVVQGWALYSLHLIINRNYWPATDQAWLTAFYSIVLLVPATLQLLAEHIRKPLAPLLITALALAVCYMGWHNGNAVDVVQNRRSFEGNGLFAFEIAVLWLLTLPFLQMRLITGSWQLQYPVLFSVAWRNKLTLFEAGVFTGALWLLLMLWQELFHMLGIDFFRELFRKQIFIYPVTSITFGLALHLIGSVERFTAIVLEQLLNVLKWLAIVAGLILALFSITLMFKLPELVSTGRRAIGAAWLLWLVAVIVLLLNAAHRDGSSERPYPQWIATALRFIVPLTTVIAVTASYALYVRTSRYGLTVERTWAFIVAGATVMYSVGYSAAAVRGGQWMSGLSRVNIVTALALIAAVSLALTPILSPYRLAANSQYRRAMNPAASDVPAYRRDSAFTYLRFDAGKYGQRRLRELSAITDHPRAEEIRRAAQAALATENRWNINEAAGPELEQRLAKLRTFPAGTQIDPDLQAQLLADLSRRGNVMSSQLDCYGLFIDLDADGDDEFVLISPQLAQAYEHSSGKWTFIGTLNNRDGLAAKFAQDLTEGSFRAEEHQWRDLIVGDRRYRFMIGR